MLANIAELCKPFIKPGGRVLDVGSGAFPFPHATHLLDPFANEESEQAKSQRGNLAFQIPSGHAVHVVKGRGEDIPFPDKFFSLAICAETLNHCDDPVKVLKELARVAEAVYIDVPSAVHELFEPHIEHKWRCFKLPNRVIGFSKRQTSSLIDKLESIVGTATWCSDSLLRHEYWDREAAAQTQFYIQEVFTPDSPVSGVYLEESEVIDEELSQALKRVLGAA